MSLLLCALVSVIDGDTITGSCHPDTFARIHIEQPVKIRIANIDAPEFKTCRVEAEASKSALQALLVNQVSGASFRVDTLYKDRYGRVVGIVTTESLPEGDDDISAAGKVSIGDEMIRLGFAKSWKHSPEGKSLEPKPKGC